jgi:hypothetical protein
MGFIIGTLALIAGVAQLVFWVMTIVRCFQTGKVLQGVISIIFCGIGAYIIGWINVKNWNYMNIMIAWTIAWIITAYYSTTIQTPAAMP